MLGFVFDLNLKLLTFFQLHNIAVDMNSPDGITDFDWK